MTNKISQKVSILLFIFSVTAVLLISIPVYLAFNSALRNSIAQEQLKGNQDLLNDVDRLLYERSQSIQNIASEIEFNFNYLHHTDTAWLSERLATQTVTTGPWDILRVVDQNANVIADSRIKNYEEKILPNYQGYQYLMQALEGNFVYSDVVIAKESGYRTIIFAVPVYINNPNISDKYVVMGYLSWPVVEEILSNINTNHFWLVNNNHTVISTYCLQDCEKLDEEFFSSESNNDLDFSSDNHTFSTDVNDPNHGKVLTTINIEQGHLSYQGNNWTLITQRHDDEIFLGATKRSMVMAIALSSIAVMSSALLALGLRRIVSKPVDKIITVVKKYATGNYSEKINIKSHDEFEVLASTLNEMSDKIIQNKNLLESEVDKRTAELKSTKDKLEQQQTALMNILEDTQELEQEVKDERDKMDMIVTSMGEGLLVVDKDYKISLINPTAEKLLETTHKESIGRPWTEIVTAYKGNTEIPFEQRTSIQVINKAVTIYTDLEKDHYYKVQTGRKFPVVSVTSPILKDGHTIAAVKVFRDASIEKETQIIIEQAVKLRTQEIQEQKAQMSSVLENAGEGIVITNDEGLVTYANPAFLKMLQVSSEFIVNKDFAATIKAFDLQNNPIPPAEISDTAAITAAKQEAKILIEATNQKRIAVVVSAAPIKVESEFRGIVRIFHDFTEDLNLQRQKDDFFSIASHELRTPLTVISGNLDTILQGYGESQITDIDKQMLQDTLTSADRLAKLVEDFLNISRLDQGRIKYTIQAVNHCTVVQSVLNELKPLASLKNISMSSSCTAKDAQVLADEGLFKEILINLIGNSIKFTESGGISIDTKVNNNLLEMRITDTGMGIDPSMQGKLFRRFQQAMKRTLNREAGGTGLGLYISREFAHMMNGDLILETSVPGEGSTFLITLPLANPNSG